MESLNYTGMISEIVKEEMDTTDEEKEGRIYEARKIEDNSDLRSTKVYFECAHCDKQIVKSNFYVKHVQEEHGGSTLICCFCAAKFESGEAFLDHVKLHGRNRKKDGNTKSRSYKQAPVAADGDFSCIECKKVFK